MDYKVLLAVAVAAVAVYYFQGSNPDNGGLLPLYWNTNHLNIVAPKNCIDANPSHTTPTTYFCPMGGWSLYSYTSTWNDGTTGYTYNWCCPTNQLPPPLNIITTPPQSQFRFTNAILNGGS